MSKQLNIHLFNCDRTYKLDVVEKWLNASHVKSKLGIDVKVKQHIFPLSKMTEWSSETIPVLEMDVAVFVVHAHESRLSINEENAGIGYAKLYRALQKRTGGKVLIVIGGDDSYKDENEEDTAFISRWAKRKISSQFSGEFIDGTKSFIFSWNQKHRAIHEEALVHFLDDRKRGKKFEYQPKGKSSQVSETAVSPKANECTRGKDSLERKSTQGQNRRDATKLDTFAVGDKPTGMNTYPGASRGKGMTEKKKEDSFRMDGGDPLQSDTSRKASWSSGNTTLHSGKEGSYRHMGDNDHSVGSDPLKSGAFPTPSSGVYPSLYSDKPGGFQGDTSRNTSSSGGYTSLHGGKEGSFPRMGESDHSVRSDPLQSGAFGSSSSEGYPSLYSDTPSAFQGLAPAESKDTLQKELAVLGCNVLEGSIYAVMDAIESIRPKLNLQAQPPAENLSPAEAKLYLERYSLKFCVLVVDAGTVKDAYENLPKRRAEYEDLLKTAVERVAMKVIILVCGSVSFPEEDEERVYGTIYHTIKEKEKGFIVWLKKGNVTVEADVLAKLLNPALTMSFVMLPCSSRGFAQEKTNVSPFSLNEGHHVAQPLERTLAYGLENVDMKQQQQVCFTPTSSTYTDHSPLTGKLVLKTKLRNGILSFEEGDLKFLSPDFPGVSDEDYGILREKWGHIGEITVKFVSVPRDNLQAVYCGDQGVEMADNDLILLKTRIRKGSVSFNEDDIEFHYPNWKVPEYILKSLRKAANGKLLIISDEKGNLRCHVLTAAKDKVVGMKDKAVATLLSSIPFKKSDK